MANVIARQKGTWREVAALILLPLGGIVLPVLGWFVGVYLLWTSTVWTSREKLLGTLVLPLGLFGAALLFIGGAGGRACSSTGPSTSTCTGGLPTVPAFMLGLFLLLAPLASDAYLFRRLRSRHS